MPLPRLPRIHLLGLARIPVQNAKSAHEIMGALSYAGAALRCHWAN